MAYNVSENILNVSTAWASSKSILGYGRFASRLLQGLNHWQFSVACWSINYAIEINSVLFVVYYAQHIPVQWFWKQHICHFHMIKFQADGGKTNRTPYENLNDRQLYIILFNSCTVIMEVSPKHHVSEALRSASASRQLADDHASTHLFNNCLNSLVGQ